MKTPLDAMLDSLHWSPISASRPIEKGLPIAVRSAVLKIGDRELKVYQLSDGRRVIDAADMDGFLADLIGDEPEPTHDHGDPVA